MPDSSWPAQGEARATVGTADYGIEVEAWRSFQPVAGERGDPLLAIVRLTSTQPIPPDVALGRVRLQRGPDSWGGTLAEESARPGGPTAVEFMLREGPRWTAGDSITVMAELVRNGSRLAVLGLRTVIARVD
ncbi:MAG: hypothetical protein IPK85_09330 [Gemmatimonadetes bacterium]|nr:hypothetical protein [Gemmatimonadota bacterium]